MGTDIRYFYLLCTLDVEGKVSCLTSETVRSHIAQALKSLYGEVGSAIQVDVMKFDPETSQVVLRCSEKDYVKVHSSLTLCGYFENKRCVYRVCKVSPCAISLISNSRLYVHN